MFIFKCSTLGFIFSPLFPIHDYFWFINEYDCVMRQYYETHLTGSERWNISVFISPEGVDIEAARKEEERIMLRDARQWLNSGQINDVRHAKSGGTALHVAAAKGYAEVLKWVMGLDSRLGRKIIFSFISKLRKMMYMKDCDLWQVGFRDLLILQHCCVYYIMGCVCVFQAFNPGRLWCKY